MGEKKDCRGSPEKYKYKDKSEFVNLSGSLFLP